MGDRAKDEGRIPMLERDQVPPELGVLYDALLQQRGVVPNMFKTVANTPALALGFLRCDGAFCLGPTKGSERRADRRY